MGNRNMDSGTPEDGQIPTVDLLVVSYDSLRRGDPSESTALYAACKERGFFYLDLSSSDTDKLVAVEQLFDIAKEYFSKSLEEKLRDTRVEQEVFHICGYKPRGMDQGNVKDQKDGCEGLRIPADVHLNPTANSALSIPEGVSQHWSPIAKFIDYSHEITETILTQLSACLALESLDTHIDRDGGGIDLSAPHDPKLVSTSAAVLQCYPPTERLERGTSAGHFAHTDAGSISVLFVSHWGLQVHSDARGQWEYVPPRPGCAIVNIGDSLSFLSGGRLRSSLHRVVPCRERWAAETRYSVVFFLRPSKDAVFADREGKVWRAGDWLNSKFSNYRRTHDEQMHSAMSTGKKEFIGLRAPVAL